MKNKLNIKDNIRNYGIMFIVGFGYIFLSVILQLVFDMPLMTATAVSDVIWIVVFAALFFVMRAHNEPGFEARGKMSLSRLISYILFFGLIAYSFNIVFGWFTTTFPDDNMTNRQESILSSDIIMYLFISAVLAPIQEEFMMRLFLYNLTKSKSHWLIAAIVTSFVFGAMHGTIGHAIFGTLFAIVLTLVYEYTQVWYISILGHFIYNVSTWGMALSDVSALISNIYVVAGFAFVILVSIIVLLVKTIGSKKSNDATNISTVS